MNSMTRDELLETTKALDDAVRRLKGALVYRDDPVFTEAQAVVMAAFQLERLAGRIERHAQAEKQRWFTARVGAGQ